jgi:energy-coupling factor transporter ATP-binding protein EcfA2
MKRALSVEGLSYSYPNGAEALRDVSFSIAPGERVALLGANGAGKSTLLWSLVGILPARGTVTINGVVLGRGTLGEVRRKLALAFAEPDDQLFMPTVLRDVMFGPRAAGESHEAAALQARESARRVSLAEDLLEREPHELSSGEKRRAALAAVLVSKPEVLALDEPTNSLDAPGREALAETLMALECAQLVASHDLEFVAQVCTRAIVMVAGRLVEDCDVRVLLSEPAKLVKYGLASRRASLS